MIDLFQIYVLLKQEICRILSRKKMKINTWLEINITRFSSSSILPHQRTINYNSMRLLKPEALIVIHRWLK